jgi:hypothetical protein
MTVSFPSLLEVVQSMADNAMSVTPPAQQLTGSNELISSRLSVRGQPRG